MIVEDTSDDDGDQSELEPLYCYKDYWLQRLNWEGVERALQRHRRQLPYFEVDGRGPKIKGNPFCFYWRVIRELVDVPGKPVPAFRILGKRLFGNVDEKKSDFLKYQPVVELIQVSSDPKEYRLYSCRNFSVGDPILFFAKFEEESGESILGGGYARVVEEPSECNAYLAKNRMLRCSKTIRAGDEIIRCAQGVHTLDYLETIDRVVVSMVNCQVGRIGLGYRRGDPSSVVRFGDQVETVREFHVQVYRNHRIV